MNKFNVTRNKREELKTFCFKVFNTAHELHNIFESRLKLFKHEFRPMSWKVHKRNINDMSKEDMKLNHMNANEKPNKTEKETKNKCSH